MMDAANRSQPGESSLLDRVRAAIRARHYSLRTEEAYAAWVKRYILFHRKRHPVEMGPAEITQFLTALAVERHVSASTQNQALAALLFLYRYVLGRDPGWLDGVVRARRPQRLPVVLTRPEIQRLLAALRGTSWVTGALLYGSGLRLIECLRLRVKDVDFSRHEILVREGKGAKDRVTMLPRAVAAPLAVHLERVRRLHDADRVAGFGRVALPTRWSASIPVRHRTGRGSGSSPPRRSPSIHAPAYGAVTTCMNPSYRRRCMRRRAAPASPGRWARTPCAIASPPTCWRTATTSAPSRSCWATGT